MCLYNVEQTENLPEKVFAYKIFFKFSAVKLSLKKPHIHRSKYVSFIMTSSAINFFAGKTYTASDTTISTYNTDKQTYKSGFHGYKDIEQAVRKFSYYGISNAIQGLNIACICRVELSNLTAIGKESRKTVYVAKNMKIIEEIDSETIKELQDKIFEEDNNGSSEI